MGIISKFFGGGSILPYVTVVVLLMIGMGYWYFHYSQGKIKELTEANTTLKADIVTLTDANDTNLKAISDLENNFVKQQQNIDELQEKFDQAEKGIDDLSKKFSEHNLEKLSNAKPKLIEKIINDATKKSLEEFRTLSTNK